MCAIIEYLKRKLERMDIPMRVKDDLVLRQVAGEYVVVPVGEQTVNMRCVITLNETGAFLWRRLEQEETRQGLVDALLNEYDVQPDKARADVDEFLGRLSQAELLR